MKENKNSTGKKAGLLIALAVALVVIIGGTYAWLTLTKTGTKVNVITTGTFELILDDNASEGISITGDAAQPIPTSEGITLDGYNFTLRNTGDISANYTIYLDDITTIDGTEEGTPVTNRMKDKYVRYALNYTEKNETALLNTTGEHPNRILYTGTLAGGASKDFNLKLWIDEAADNAVMGTTFAGKIRVEAIQTKSGIGTNNENPVTAPTTPEAQG